MITTMSELRQMIAENCDLSQPLRAVAHDVSKKADRHSQVRVDENHPARFSVSKGLYDERGSVEFSYYDDAPILMPQDALDALDNLLEEDPKAHIGFVYFFYFPIEVTFFLGRKRVVDNSLMDTNKLVSVTLSDCEPNTLVFEAPFTLGEFDV